MSASWHLMIIFCCSSLVSVHVDNNTCNICYHLFSLFSHVRKSIERHKQGENKNVCTFIMYLNKNI